MLGTRPDIAFAITALSQFSSNYGVKHWTAVKHVLRYLQGTQDYKLTYVHKKTGSGPVLFGYCDSDWGNDVDDRRSYTGYAFLLSGGAVSWQSKKQPTTALSSVEAEYMAATQATKEAIWWRTFLSELGLDINGSTILLSDSKGSMDLAKNPEHHARTKHIDIRHHFIREQVTRGTVKMVFVGTENMGADVLTKPLAKTRHLSMLQLLGIHRPQSEWEYWRYIHPVSVLSLCERGPGLWMPVSESVMTQIPSAVSALNPHSPTLVSA